MIARPDPSTLDVQALDRAEVDLERRYGLPSLRVVEDREDPDAIPLDVLAWWRASDARRRQLIEEMARGAHLYVSDVESMELRKERLRKPGPPR